MLARLRARRAIPVCLHRSRLIVGRFGCRAAVSRPTTPNSTSPWRRRWLRSPPGVITFSQATSCSKLALSRNDHSCEHCNDGRENDRESDSSVTVQSPRTKRAN